MYGRYCIPLLLLGLLARAIASPVQTIENNTIYPATEAIGPRPLFTQIANKFYFIETEIQKNWHDAYATCRQMGAHLISFDTADEWVAVTNYLVKNEIISDIWTSGSELAIQGNHVWFPTTDPISLALWRPGEPSNDFGKEHCDHILFDKEFVGLNDFNCEAGMRFICVIPKQPN